MRFSARLMIALGILGIVFAMEAQARWSRPARPASAMAAPGRDYVRLWDWAQNYKFNIRWLRTGKILELSNRNGNRLVFTAESREAQINGTTVMLSFPITINGGAGWISSLDLRAAVQPILFPRKNPKGDKIKTIVLDPGHGGKDMGAQNGAWQEKKYTLLLAQELYAQLTRAGFSVSLTRTEDVYIDLPPRPEAANRRRADLFVSLHFNTVASGTGQVSGSQVYCFTPIGASSTNARGEGTENSASPGNRNDSQNVLLAYQIQKSLTQTLRVPDRGVCRGRLAVLRDAKMPAVLVEAGYISNPAEGKKIVDPIYRRQMAQAIVNGVIAYKRLVEQ